MMYWLGIWILVWWCAGTVLNVILTEDTLERNTPGRRLARIILSLPSLYFVWTAWQMYR